jgi:hypothetical protein
LGERCRFKPEFRSLNAASGEMSTCRDLFGTVCLAACVCCVRGWLIDIGVEGGDRFVVYPLVAVFLFGVVRTLITDVTPRGGYRETPRVEPSRMRRYLVVAPVVTLCVWPVCRRLAERFIRTCPDTGTGVDSIMCSMAAMAIAILVTAAVHAAVGVWGFHECYSRSPPSLRSTRLWRTTLLAARVVTASMVLMPFFWSLVWFESESF